MAAILLSAQRTRHRYIERTLYDYHETLRKNDDAGENGRIHPEASKRFRRVLGNLVVANVRHGIISIPKEAKRNEEYIPITAVFDGEELRQAGDINSLPPSSRIIGDETLRHLGVTYQENRDTMLNSTVEETAYVSVPQDTAAIETSAYSEWCALPPNGGSAIHVNGRPIIALGEITHSERHIKPMCPTIIHHEIAHVIQDLQNPVVCLRNQGALDDLFIAREIEAELYTADIADELNRQSAEQTSGIQVSDFHCDYTKGARDVVRKFTKNFQTSQATYAIIPSSEIVQHARKSGKFPTYNTNLISKTEKERSRSLL